MGIHMNFSLILIRNGSILIHRTIRRQQKNLGPNTCSIGGRILEGVLLFTPQPRRTRSLMIEKHYRAVAVTRDQLLVVVHRNRPWITNDQLLGFSFVGTLFGNVLDSDIGHKRSLHTSARAVGPLSGYADEVANVFFGFRILKAVDLIVTCR